MSGGGRDGRSASTSPRETAAAPPSAGEREGAAIQAPAATSRHAERAPTERDGQLISVLMGVYNGAPYLAEAIESILGQTYRPLELVVVDDGSDDGSGEIAQSYGDLVRYVRQENAGDGAARNTAVGVARGALFAFMDADDRSSADRLERQHAALAADPALAAVFAHTREFLSPEPTEAQRARVRLPSTEAVAWLSPTSMLIRREAFALVGPFSETLRLGSTVDWCARAIDLGLRTEMLSDILMERRLHTSNLGLRRSDSRHHYLEVVKSSLERRRTLGAEAAGAKLGEEQPSGDEPG